MMIDWVSAIIPCRHTQKLRGGKFMIIDSDGVIESSKDRYLSVEGSYSSKIVVKSLYWEDDKQYINQAYARHYFTNPPGYIYFSGNPVKFLKGHNLYGSTDVVKLMRDTLEIIFRQLDLHPTKTDWHRIVTGDYPLTRVDINEMIPMRSLAQVLAWIRTTAHLSRSRHKSGGILKGDTLYWGMDSRRWAMKVYAKGQEINAREHILPSEIPARKQLIKWAQNKLRWELVIRSPELKKQRLDSAAAFANADLRELFDSYKGRIIIPENIDLSPSVLTQLPRNLRSTYALWRSGEDLRQTLSKNTYYRHRRLLLAHGVDIHVPHTTEQDIP